VRRSVRAVRAAGQVIPVNASFMRKVVLSMGGWSTGRRAAVVAAAMIAGAVLPAAAQAAEGPDSDDWGTIVKGVHCAQSDAWIARVQGLQRTVDTALFEAHSPATPTAPEAQNGGQNLVNLTVPPGIGLGVVSALYSKALTDRLPTNSGGSGTVPAPCAAHARAGGGSVDVGVPYVAAPVAGGTQLSPIGVHVDAIDVEATSRPGHPVAFKGGAVSGYLSSFGRRIINIPKIWPVNFGVRVPADRSQPAFALATTNEQVTTDSEGKPTLDAKGHYKYDPTATSGYINGIHATVLGTTAADATVAHAAVIQKGGGPGAVESAEPQAPPAGLQAPPAMPKAP